MTKEQTKAVRSSKVAYHLQRDIEMMLIGHRDAQGFWEKIPNGVNKYWYFAGAVDLSRSITDTLARRMTEFLDLEEIEEIIKQVEG